MKNQEIASALPYGAQVIFAGQFPEGTTAQLDLGVGSKPSPKPRKWIIPVPVCNVLWALLFGYEVPKQSTSRRR